jgi:hypothetical protein
MSPQPPLLERVQILTNMPPKLLNRFSKVTLRNSVIRLSTIISDREHYLAGVVQISLQECKMKDDTFLNGVYTFEGLALPYSFDCCRYASFFNRSTVSIVEQLISGGKVLSDSSEGNQVRILDQIPVPKPYVNDTFGALFTGLLRRDHMLALGLYRPVTAHGSLVSYVFTNPPPHEPLELKDLVFVLR